MVSIEAPELKPVSRKTLLDVANVITGAPAYALHTALKYERRVTDGENTDVPTDDTEKQFTKRDYATTTPKLFTAYRGLNEPLLNGPGDAGSELEALFQAGEALYVEKKVQQLLLSPLAVDISPTPGTPLKDSKAALGLLEQWISSRFLFQPTVSGNLLATNLIQPGVPAITETAHGVPIASAAGFGDGGPQGAATPPGSAWLYISGQINIWPGEATLQNASDHRGNRDYVLAEKAYAASVDGPVAAILIGF